MKIANVSKSSVWSVGFCKNGKMAKWNDKVTPVKVTIDGTSVELYANYPASDYIYFRWNNVARFIWCKDGVGMDILKLKKLVITDQGKEAVMVKAIRIEVDEIVDVVATETHPDVNGEGRKALVIKPTDRAILRQEKIAARRAGLGR